MAETSTDTAKDSEQAREEPLTASARIHKAEGLVRRNVYWALGIGLVPFPVVDVIGLTAVGLKMVRELSNLYGVTFRENTARAIISSLIISLGGVGIAGLVVGSLVKLLPIIGQTVGVVSVSAVASAFTHALGNVFILHFESGGTLLNFNAEKMREHFLTEFEKAKATVHKMSKEDKSKGPVA